METNTRSKPQQGCPHPPGDIPLLWGILSSLELGFCYLHRHPICEREDKSILPSFTACQPVVHYCFAATASFTSETSTGSATFFLSPWSDMGAPGYAQTHGRGHVTWLLS